MSRFLTHKTAGLFIGVLLGEELLAQTLRKDVARVEKVAGEVRRLESHHSAIAPNAYLREGDLLYAGDSLETALNGKIKIRFHEGKNTLVLGANSYLTVESAPMFTHLAKQKKGTQVFLARGDLRAQVTPFYYNLEKGEGFEIRTRNSVAGVRGTDFYLNFDAGDYVSTLATLTGEVNFKGAKGAGLPISAGFLSRILADGRPTNPSPINMEDEDTKRRIQDSLSFDTPEVSGNSPTADDALLR